MRLRRITVEQIIARGYNSLKGLAKTMVWDEITTEYKNLMTDLNTIKSKFPFEPTFVGSSDIPFYTTEEIFQIAKYYFTIPLKEDE